LYQSGGRLHREVLCIVKRSVTMDGFAVRG
jgi:hypothetical protein